MIYSLQGSNCCGYGSVGTDTIGYDCVIIPGAAKETAKRNPAPNSICGNGKGLITTTKASKKASKTVCSKNQF
jgi:hypothetical protein